VLKIVYLVFKKKIKFGPKEYYYVGSPIILERRVLYFGGTFGVQREGYSN
jgi:hypothetical protein